MIFVTLHGELLYTELTFGSVLETGMKALNWIVPF